jgi:hypothetical protein
VVIPHQASPRRIEYSIPQKEKCIICIMTISMASDVLTVLRVMRQKAVDDAVWQDGWRGGQDFLIRSSDTS